MDRRTERVTEGLSGRNSITSRNPHILKRAKSRSNPVAMQHHDPNLAANLTCKRDGSIGNGTYDLARSGSKVDSSITSPVGV